MYWIAKQPHNLEPVEANRPKRHELLSIGCELALKKKKNISLCCIKWDRIYF